MNNKSHVIPRYNIFIYLFVYFCARWGYSIVVGIPTYPRQFLKIITTKLMHPSPETLGELTVITPGSCFSRLATNVPSPTLSDATVIRSFT